MCKLFAKEPKRLDILSLKQIANAKKIVINVHRNHSFETIGSVLNPFLWFSSLNAEINYSSYDDSLNIDESILNADLEIIWLDAARYKIGLQYFLEEKINFIRNYTSAPILVACLDFNFCVKKNHSDVFTLDINKTISVYDDLAYDLLKQKHSGTRLSNKSTMKIAQILGLKIIPSIILPSLKAIILDLDNTLYEGTVGEDGIDNLIPNNLLQAKLKELKTQGFILCIASKNDFEDAMAIFNKRNDFVLDWNDFNIAKIDWNSKIDNIRQIAKELNIGLDAILFIDDNIAEIEHVLSADLGIKTLLAQGDKETLARLELYPCLMKKKLTKEDNLRSQDLIANKQRQEFIKKFSNEEYFKKLELKVDLILNDIHNVDRISELLNKTNQFILSYKRYNKTKVLGLLHSKNICIVTVEMRDKLSNSGIIAVLIAKKQNLDLIVDELTISCRALGRNIEDIVVFNMLKLAQNYLKTSHNVFFEYKNGERNSPGLAWLEKFTGFKAKDNGIIKYDLPSFINDHGLEITLIGERDVACQ